MKTGHTPGPWRVYENTAGAVHIGTSHAGISHFVICDVMPLHMCKEANARLIAAAPELLAACRALVSMYSSVAPCGQSPVVDQARAAIAKAEAE